MASLQGMTSLVPTLGGAALFVPTDIAGLQLWLDANDASTLFTDAAKTTAAGNGDVVGAWADKSGQGNDATQATTAAKPTLQYNAINGLPAVRSDSADDTLDLGGITVTNETVFVVAKHAVNNAFGAMLTANNPVHRYLFLSTANSLQYRYSGVAATTSSFIEINSNIYRGRYDGVNASNSVNNGVPVTAAVASSAHLWVDIFSESGAFNLNGDIAEMLIYDNALSVANIALVENYLANKWGITLS